MYYVWCCVTLNRGVLYDVIMRYAALRCVVVYCVMSGCVVVQCVVISHCMTLRYALRCVMV